MLIPELNTSVVTRLTNFRWKILLIIFVTYTINFADRTNIGVIIPFLRPEFGLTNFEAGAIASFFFLGYAVSQIPAGLYYGRFGVRGLATLSIFLFSTVTYLIGTVTSFVQMKWLRFMLGIVEGPTPVGITSTINNWFPPKEKATATGIGYIGATMFAPIIVPPLAVWIAVNYGWRYVFYWFSVPGILMAIVWYIFVRNWPAESPFCSQKEVTYIQDVEVHADDSQPLNRRNFVWLDKFIRAKNIPLIETTKEIFLTWNVWGNTLAYFLMCSILQGLLAWIPSYLVMDKGYSFMRMGFIASSPWIGGLIGSAFGGWLSDKILESRRKPTMLLTALSTGIMMLILINVPENITLVAITLFMVGFLINVGWPAFTAYPMGFTTSKTYPTTIVLVNSGGNLGGFFSPMIAGLLLDTFHNFNLVFTYLGITSILGFLIILTLTEPKQSPIK